MPPYDKFLNNHVRDYDLERLFKMSCELGATENEFKEIAANKGVAFDIIWNLAEIKLKDEFITHRNGLYSSVRWKMADLLKYFGKHRSSSILSFGGCTRIQWGNSI